MKITESSIKVPESNLLSNPLVWNSLRKGDLVITEDLNKKKNKREALLVLEIHDYEILTQKLSSGYNYTISYAFRGLYWI